MEGHGQSRGPEQQIYATYPSLRGKRVLITGGATGIGEVLVTRFAEQGARVAFLDVQDGPAEELAARLANNGNLSPLYLHCELSDVTAIRDSVAKIISSFDGIDVLVNNAGNDERHSIEEVTSAMWDRLMAVNLRHQFFATQATLPAMKRSLNGSIINMSSIAWMIPSTGLPVYISAKASIVGLTRALAHEVGKENIRVNCVLPGSIVTDRQSRLWLTPEYKAEILSRQALKRHLVPDEVARLILFLAADDSSGMTGQSYIVDGGWV
jgi:NAD(P)-dependent dehydrogenase (short-subunit alcohol dehydrogenase family)